jgi:hypothetical protein
MSFTAELGTSDSMPGNIALGMITEGGPLPKHARASVRARTSTATVRSPWDLFAILRRRTYWYVRTTEAV